MESPRLTPAQRDVIAEFGPLYNARKGWAPKEKRYKALCIEIQSWYPNLPAGQTALAEGASFDVQIGEQAMVKDWKSLAAVSKAVGGAKAFLAIATATYKAVSGVLGNSAAASLQVETQTGYRKLVAVARVAPLVDLPTVVELPKAA